jgi:FKBP-type peptidyl-prolyl cis-trans isomerase FklB
MKIKMITLAIAVLSIMSCNNATGQKVNLKTSSDSVAYAIGMNIGTSLHRDSIKIDSKVFLAALELAMKGDTAKLQLKQADLAVIFQKLQADMQAKKEKEANAKGAANAEKGKKFLEENKKKAGVKVTASGLQYEVIKAGTGKAPNDKSKVKVHYKGTLIDGTVFDSSLDRGEPVEFDINGIIPGWTEALKLMKEGDKWKLYIPSDLAYGPRGAGGQIGPNETLIFEVELLEVKAADAK